MPGIEGGADPDRKSQKFGAKAVLDPQPTSGASALCNAAIAFSAVCDI
jgi:hypothetical protein